MRIPRRYQTLVIEIPAPASTYAFAAHVGAKFLSVAIRWHRLPFNGIRQDTHEDHDRRWMADGVAARACARARISLGLD